MFRLAEAFIEFVTRGYAEAVSQLANAGNEAQQFGLIAVSAAGQSEALSNAMILVAADASQAALRVNVLATSVNRFNRELAITGEMQRRIGGPIGGPGVFVGPSPASRLGGAGIAGFLGGPGAVPQITRDLGAAGDALQRFIRSIAMTGIGGPIFSMLTAGLMGITRAASAANAALAAMGITLTIGTGGIFAILAGIAAALIAIGLTFKTAFAADPAAQAMLREMADDIRSIMEIVGAPLVAAFKALVAPMAECISLTERFVRRLDQALGLVIGLRVGWAGIAAIISQAGAGLEAMGLLAPNNPTNNSPMGGGSSGSRVGLEEFEKQIANAIGRADEKEMAKRQVAALENINREGVIIRNPNDVRQPAAGFAP